MWEVPRPHDKITIRAMTASNRPSEPADTAEKLHRPEAERALREAAERRAAVDSRARELARPKEHQGRGGLEPVRYDDWEVKGLASDF